jgi:hypothetical protein
VDWGYRLRSNNEGDLDYKYVPLSPFPYMYEQCLTPHRSKLKSTETLKAVVAVDLLTTVRIEIDECADSIHEIYSLRSGE